MLCKLLKKLKERPVAKSPYKHRTRLQKL